MVAGKRDATQCILLGAAFRLSIIENRGRCFGARRDLPRSRNGDGSWGGFGRKPSEPFAPVADAYPPGRTSADSL